MLITKCQLGTYCFSSKKKNYWLDLNIQEVQFKRSIFQTFWRLHSCTIFLFYEFSGFLNRTILYFLKKKKLLLQVNLCQKLIFLHQLIYNMTTDCSWNYHEHYKRRTWAEHVFPMFCTFVILWVNWYNNKCFWKRFTCNSWQIYLKFLSAQVRHFFSKTYLYFFNYYNCINQSKKTV